ncbi:hypothetical protein C8R43DRAFT_1236399 [Mycena crocata]|nr:hypothetical protein C8R43DRAFT_1236399 [Mycena crocata]
MSSLENRFRIPGGSLDLDFDDDHEKGTAEVVPPDAASTQTVSHFTPEELSRVLSWIPSPMAPRTAEYASALNISGDAFRNLDLQALTILADNDPMMSEQLVLIQRGVLPSVPPPTAAPIQNNPTKDFADAVLGEGSGDSKPPDVAASPALTPSNSHPSDVSSDDCPPSPLPPLPSLSPPIDDLLPQTVAGARAVTDCTENRATDEDVNSKDHGATSSTEQDKENPEPICGNSSFSSADSGIHNGDRRNPDAKDDESSRSDDPSTSSENAISVDRWTVVSTMGGHLVEDVIPLPPSDPRPSDETLPGALAPSSSLPGSPVRLDLVATLPSSVSSESFPGIQMSGQSSVSEISGTVAAVPNTSPQRPTRISSDADAFSDAGCTTTVECESLVLPAAEYGTKKNSDSANPDLRLLGETVSTKDQNGTAEGLEDQCTTADGNTSEAWVPSAGVAAAKIAGLGEAAQANLATVDHGDCFPPSLSAPPQGQGGPPAISIQVSKNNKVRPSNEISTDYCVRATTLSPGEASRNLPQSPTPRASTSFTSSDDVNMPCADITLRVPETSSLSNVLRTDPVDDTSFLDFDLLQFSPLSLNGHVAQDTEILFLGELFRENTSIIGAHTPLPGCSMRESLCEKQAESKIEPSEESFRSMQRSPTARACTAAGTEGSTLALPKNNGQDDRTRGPASEESSWSPTILAHNQPNQRLGTCTPERRTDSYFSPPLGKAVDPLRSRTETDDDVKDNSGTCDIRILEIASNGPNISPADLFHGPAADLDEPLTNTDSPTPAETAHMAAASVSCSPGTAAKMHAGTAEPSASIKERHEDSMKSVRETHDLGIRKGFEFRPPLLGLSIPISPTSLGEELSQLSPLFSPLRNNESSAATECSPSGPLFSERCFSVSRTPAKTPVKLRRGMRHPVYHSRGTETADSGFNSCEAKRVLVDVAAQTNDDAEVDNLRRRVKTLERELRSLRAMVRRPEDHVRESKPRSFWKKMAATDRVVPSPEPLSFGLLKDFSWNSSTLGQESSTTSSGI